MSDVRSLRAWHRARALAVEVIEAFPERAGRRVPKLRNQTIRAATAIAARLAEGCARPTRADFLHYIGIALGSMSELETHLLTAREAGVIPPAPSARLARSMAMSRKLLIGLQRSVERDVAKEEAERSKRRRGG